MSDPQAFVLLTLRNATLTTNNLTYDGTLALECVTIPFSAQQGLHQNGSTPLSRDVYLVLRIDTFESAVDPSRPIRCSKEKGYRYYTFLGANGEEVALSIPEPNSRELHLLEDLETFDGILTQYADLKGPLDVAASSSAMDDAGALLPPPTTSSGQPPDLRGHLVLVNRENGEVVSQLDNKRFVVHEDPSLNEKGHEKDAVVIEIPEDDEDGAEEDARTVFVRSIPPGQGDVITKGASVVSYAISGTASLLVTAMSSASNMIIKHTDPHPYTIHQASLVAQAQSQAFGSSPSASGPIISKSLTDSPISATPNSQIPPPLPSRALVFLTHERTKKGLSSVHAFSGQAVQVSNKTLGVIDNMIRRVVGGSDSGKQAASSRSTPKIASPSPRPSSSLSPGSNSLSAPLPANLSRRSSPTPSSLGPPPYAREKPLLPPRTPERGLSPVPPPLPSRGPSPLPVTPNGEQEKVGTKDRLLASAGLILSTIDSSAKQILDVGASSLDAVVGHKYGPEAAQTTSLLTGTARNVGLVYIDMRGIGRTALVKRVGKQAIKNQMTKRKDKQAVERGRDVHGDEGGDIAVEDLREKKKRYG